MQQIREESAGHHAAQALQRDAWRWLWCLRPQPCLRDMIWAPVTGNLAGCMSGSVQVPGCGACCLRCECLTWIVCLQLAAEQAAREEAAQKAAAFEQAALSLQRQLTAAVSGDLSTG